MKRIFIFVFILLFVLSGYAEVKWNIDITEIQLDYLDFDSIDAMNQQLEKIQKNKDYIKANKSFTTLWDKNHSENYLNSTRFIECAVTHDLALFYLDKSYNTFPKEWKLDYKNFSRKNYVLSDLENEYKKYYKTDIDKNAVSDYKKALNELKDLELYNIVYFSEMGSKESYDLALKSGEWITEFYKITQKWPVQNMEIISAIIKENGYDTKIPYLYETVAFSLYLSIYYGTSVPEKINALYGSSIPKYSSGTLAERNKILANKENKENKKYEKNNKVEVNPKTTITSEKLNSPYSEEAIQKEYSYISNPDSFNNRIIRSRDGFYGLINHKNQNVILCILHSLSYNDNLGCYVGKNGNVIVYYDSNGNLIKSETVFEQNNNYYSNNSSTATSTSSAMADQYRRWADECFKWADRYEQLANDALANGDSILYQLNIQKSREQKRKGNEYLKMVK